MIRPISTRRPRKSSSFYTPPRATSSWLVLYLTKRKLLFLTRSSRKVKKLRKRKMKKVRNLRTLLKKT